MLNLPVLRWGKPYDSLEKDEVLHFITGEPIAQVSQAGGGLLQRDMRHAHTARALLRDLPCEELIQRLKRAGDLYLNDTLPIGDGTQTPDEFARAQSATTGLPEHMCKANMQKNFFVLSHMDQMLEALTRGLPLEVLTRGYGVESRGVVVSYQAQTPALGLVLPSNSPGVHTLWMPVVPMQIGLVLKPGPQEPWTPYRMTAAMIEAGIPAGAISIYPGGGDVGAAVLASCSRSLIFGGSATVERYRGNPAVQAHGPGFSKILLGDDVVDRWADYLDLMVESVYINSGRGCINCSSIWASRHTREIAAAIADRIGPIEPCPPEDPEAGLAAFTVPGAAASIWKMIEADLREGGVEHTTDRFGPRLVEMPRCGYLRPVVAHAESPAAAIVKKEFMFPFVAVVKCAQEQMLSAIGPTLVCSAITDDAAFQQSLADATHIDRLNLGQIPTTKLDWLQPHEGNIVDFLFRARALQIPSDRLAKLQN
jgi:acyl-CoA reductase-like NAD-dependent aldehyde dehydrogenase